MITEYDADLISAAEKFRIDVNLIRSIAAVESSGNTWANRYEPAVTSLNRPSDYADKLCISQITEEMNQKTSWGLMQVMGYVARNLGYSDDLPMLCNPSVGIFYGCKLLKQLSQRYSDEADIIAAYNAGSARKDNTGMYLNQPYVDKVHNYLIKFRQLL